MKSKILMLAVVLVCVSLGECQHQTNQRDQLMAQQQQQSQPELQKSNAKVTRRDYPYDNSWWAIGLILVPLLILLCFPLFSTPYYHGGHHGHGHHGGWGWGRSASGKDFEQVQEKVLKSIEG